MLVLGYATITGLSQEETLHAAVKYTYFCFYCMSMQPHRFTHDCFVQYEIYLLDFALVQ